MKNKIIYYTSLSIFGAVVIAIVVMCIMFLCAPSQNGDTNNTGNDSSSYSFDYGSDVDLLFGDTFDLSPKETKTALFYAPMELGIVSISQDGLLTTHKCGSVTIKIWDGEDLIKTVDISISIKCALVDLGNCSVENNTIFMASTTCFFNIAIINSNNSPVPVEELPTLSTSEGISTQLKLGSFWISATKDGTLTISFPNIDAEYTLNIKAT